MKPLVTQRDLASKVGVTNGLIAHIETGRTLPGKYTQRALARALVIYETDYFKEAGF